MLWAEEVHTCEIVSNSMEKNNSTKDQFGIFYGDKPKIIGLFSEFGPVVYVMIREKIKGQMKNNTYK